MSGGRWNYEDQALCSELFGGFGNHPTRGETFEMSRIMSHAGPFGDTELNEQLWDMFCLLYEYDWYKSGDTSVEEWQKARVTYKDKWFGKTPEERARRIAENEILFFKDIVEHVIEMKEEKHEDW